MNVKMAGQTIRDTVTMEQVLDLYGYRTRGGFMRCPFHGERNSSLKVYGGKKGWHCYGCERGGSVIDFVMEHENCDFRTAVYAIDNALHLGLMDPREDPEDARRQLRLQHALDNFADEIYQHCNLRIRMIEASKERNYKHLIDLEDKKAKDIQSVTADEWTFLLAWQDEEEYNNYRIEKINEFKEEVAAWRRSLRRAR